MAGQNDFLIFDENGDNMLTQANYASDTDRSGGFQTGLARSNVTNKVLHQTSMMCHAIGEIAKDNNLSATDNSTVSDLKDTLNQIFGNASDRGIGQIITSTIPLTDAGLHLLDGSLISGSGSYAVFVSYISSLYFSNPNANYFCTEANWQASVATYGVCGKFVYDSVNNTVRLPKITGFIEGAGGVANIGDVTAAGLPSHTHTRGDMNITGTMSFNGTDPERQSASSTGCFATSYWISGGNDHDANVGNAGVTYTMNAANSWTGSTSNPNYTNNIQNSSTVQPQSVQVLYYIVVANSTKTEIEVDIDEIATDLNGKADKDLSNLDTYGNNRLHALKGYLDEGELLTDGEGLADLNKMAHSTFDASKFTVQGSPTITDGVASGFSASNYLTASLPNAITLDKVDCYGKFTTSTNYIGFGCILTIGNPVQVANALVQIAINNIKKIGVGCHNGTTWTGYYSTNTVSDNTTYYYHLYYDSGLKLDMSTDNVNWTNWITATPTVDSTLSKSALVIGSGVSDTTYFTGSIDLKYLSAFVDGSPVFAGTKGGTHTYTIGGSTVSIPYTLSKTGSMIVDSYYRTQVNALYAQEGIAPYFTLQEGVNFTLPQGEPYGMIQTAYANMLPDYASAIDISLGVDFTAPCDGYLYCVTVNTSGEHSVKINGIDVIKSTSNAGTYNATTLVPIAKGSVAHNYYEAGEFKFIPMKGAN